MMKFYLLFTVLFAITFARTYYTIDDLSFGTVIPAGNDPFLSLFVSFDIPADHWYSPFYGFQEIYTAQPGALADPTDPPKKYLFFNTNGVIGGQRDFVIGVEEGTVTGANAQVSIFPSKGLSSSFSLGYVGGIYYQYDGLDAITGTALEKAWLLNTRPGIGAVNSILANGDGQTVDLTANGAITGMYITIDTDHPVDYYIDLLDAAGNANSYHLLVQPSSNGDPVLYFIPYASSNWVFSLSQFTFNRVSALQVRVWSFNDQSATSNAIDTAWISLILFGYTIPVTVGNDCDCNGIVESSKSGVSVSLYRGTITTPTGTALSTGVTDANGAYTFTSTNSGLTLADGTYTVCIDASLSLCTGVSRCQTRTLANNVDPAVIPYRVTVVSTLTPPANRVVNCGDCTTVACLGSANLVDCNGGNTPVTTSTDTTSGTCPTTITRVFTSGSQRATQTITVNDNQPPVISTQPSPVTVQCATDSPTIAQWLANNAGAVATDCSGFTWTNNYTGQAAGCASTTVVFTARDPCGNQVQVTSTYTVNDTQPPTFTTAPTAGSAQCNTNNSDFNSFNTFLSSRGGAVATDNCGAVTYTNDYNAATTTFTRGCNSVQPVNFIATDSCGRTSSAPSTFTITDTLPPVISPQAQSQSGPCSGTGNSFNDWLNNHGGAQATDQCFASSALVWSNNFTGNTPSGCSGAVAVVFTVRDPCGNQATTSASFSTSDTQAPVINPKASPLSTNCNDANSQSQLQAWLDNHGGASATDDCTGVVWTNNFSTTSGNCNSLPVTFTACDLCNPAHCSSTTATYSVNDNQAPTFTTPPGSTSVECGTNTQTAFTAWLSSNGGAVVTDNCSSASQITISNDYPANTFPTNGCNTVATVHFTARDGCGLTTVATATFSVVDSTPPTLTAVAQSQSAQCTGTSGNNSGYSTFISTRGGATATDTCTAVTWSNNGPAVPQFDGCSGTTTVVFTASDACQHTVTTQATYTITDSTPPVLSRQASDRTDECTSTSQTSTLQTWLNSNGGAQATDSCSAVTWTNNFTALSGGCTSSATVTFRASDACNNFVLSTATYTITDSAGPVISPQASNKSVPCDTNTQSQLISWLNSNGGAQATDACQGSTTGITWSNDFSGAITGCNFVTVHFTATDSCGASTTTTATFTSVDTTPPTFNPPAQDLSVECNGQGNQADFANFLATHGGAVATDSCTLSFTWTDNNAGAAAPVGCGSRRVVFTVTDGCNNSASTSATFTVVDTVPPTINPQPQPLLVECDGTGNSQQLAQWRTNNGGASATDSCSAAVTWSSTAGTTSGDNCDRVTPYTFRVVDSCGQFANATANYRVVDTTAPTLSTPAVDATYECDGTGNLGQVQAWIADNGGARATDSCQGSVTWVNDYPGVGPAACSSIRVTFTASDACGHAISSSATLFIDDTTDPTFANFPLDTTVPCDADLSSITPPTAFDSCSGELLVSYTETAIDEPPVGNCPGDHVITRNFVATDDCGNTINRNQIITVNIVKSSGPCDPTGCECDDCCPPPAASDCIAAPCKAVACNPTPCTAVACSCSSNLARDVEFGFDEVELIEPLPQCKPVYIYVHDDDDTQGADGAVAQSRMLVTNEPLHEGQIKSSGAVENQSGWNLFFF